MGKKTNISRFTACPVQLALYPIPAELLYCKALPLHKSRRFLQSGQAACAEGGGAGRVIALTGTVNADEPLDILDHGLPVGLQKQPDRFLQPISGYRNTILRHLLLPPYSGL
ncbi:hypothetical protein D3C75_818570 [compost metagenome]